MPPRSTSDVGRLTARPGRARGDARRGIHSVAGGALLSVPATYDGDELAPLALLLHGAGGSARDALNLLLPIADEHGLVLAAPQARASTWDVLVTGYGPDVEAIDDLLADAFERCAVDPARVAIGGFSDGASYALSLGAANGDLFRTILAFSPGFSAPPERRGSPQMFVSHGTGDRVLPIETTSRRIVPRLQEQGYDVRYREFAGPHTVPAPIVREAVEWWLLRERDG